MYQWIIENKELLKIIYSLAITLICAIIVFKTDKLFRLSFHQGIRYFRNAFLFYGAAFLFRYILIPSLSKLFGKYNFIPRAFFEFFLIMAGFFLLYSLLWKKLEYNQRTFKSSLLNRNILVFYLMAIIIVILDIIWNKYAFMFLSQFITFSVASIISYNNYLQRGKHRKFSKFYFLAMVLSFIAWLLNFLLVFWIGWNKGILINIYGLNIIIFLLILYGVIKLTNKN